MTTSFKTISKPSEILFKERASKFFAFVFPTNTEDEFKSTLEHIKTLHPQAGHFCYAFRLGVNGELYRYSDDGEPNNSAGKPIYGQLLSSEITQIGAIVVRYFGGTKLGVGGLVTAYKEATRLAIAEAEIITSEIKASYLITYTYDDTSAFNQLVSKFDLEIVHTKFEVQCHSVIKCIIPQKDELEKYCIENRIALQLIQD